MKVKNTVCISTLETLFKHERLSDVNFVLKKREGGLLTVPAQKHILAAWSPVFDAMFFGDLKEGSTVSILDVSAEAFCEFLQFFYLAKVELTPENIVEVCGLIDKYDVPQCLAVCEKYLQLTVTTELAFQYYELALSFMFSKEIIQSFVNIIVMDIGKTLKSPEFLQCTELALKSIIQSDKLMCDEFEVYEAVVAWATASLVKKGLTATPLNIRAELGECFYLIRFPVMTSKQFLTCMEQYPNLLNFEEYMDIMHYITDKRSLTTAAHFSIIPRGAKPIPAHLSSVSLEAKPAAAKMKSAAQEEKQPKSKRRGRSRARRPQSEYRGHPVHQHVQQVIIISISV